MSRVQSEMSLEGRAGIHGELRSKALCGTTPAVILKERQRLKDLRVVVPQPVSQPWGGELSIDRRFARMFCGEDPLYLRIMSASDGLTGER